MTRSLKEGELRVSKTSQTCGRFPVYTMVLADGVTISAMTDEALGGFPILDGMVPDTDFVLLLQLGEGPTRRRLLNCLGQQQKLTGSYCKPLAVAVPAEADGQAAVVASAQTEVLVGHVFPYLPEELAAAA